MMSTNMLVKLIQTNCFGFANCSTSSRPSRPGPLPGQSGRTGTAGLPLAVFDQVLGGIAPRGGAIPKMALVLAVFQKKAWRKTQCLRKM